MHRGKCAVLLKDMMHPEGVCRLPQQTDIPYITAEKLCYSITKAEKAEADAKVAAEKAALEEKQAKLDASIMAQETLLAEIRDLLKNK